jgi:hypothetical protein
VRLAHHGDDGNTRGCANRFGLQLGNQGFLVIIGNGGNDVDQPWRALECIFGRYSGLETIELHIPTLLVSNNELGNDITDAKDKSFFPAQL